uniref:Myb/SANT-like domain-containing protein n=1 Tax=Salix viminalis TaxID=40686 RepID=A0A6N2MP07_SALVM
MEGSDNMDKVVWTNEMLHVFCDICIMTIELGMRTTTHFDKTGWKFLIASFKERIGQSLTKAQLKNKWDGCKKDWKIWAKLISEIGVGWSSELGTISAMNEWWKEVKGAKKFRNAGIEPGLKFKYDRMYSNIVATREYVWAPSSGVQDGGNCFQPDTNDLEEESEMEANEGRAKKKTANIGIQLLSKWDHLVDSMSTRSDSAFLHMDKQVCNIHEVMDEIHSIPGIHADHDLYDFAA